MKKFFICLIAVLIIALSGVSCFAAAPVVSLGASATNVSVGDTVSVYVSISAESNLTELNFSVSYPTSNFELVPGSVKVTGLFGAIDVKESAGSVSYVGKNDEAVVNSGRLLSMQFKVLKGGGTISIGGLSSTGPESATSNSSVTFSECAHANKTSETVKNATCYAEGLKKITCPCGYTTEEKISVIPHAFGEAVITEKPTCEKEGVQTRKCTVAECGAEDKKPIDPTGHRFDDTEITKQPDCVNEGTQVAVCTVCKKKSTITSSVPAKGHTFDDSAIKTKPTCTKTGVAVGKCNVCGFESNSPTTIPATGHDFGSWTVTREPTLLMEGEQSRVCKVRSCQHVETKKIPKLTSAPDEEVTEPITNPNETPVQPIAPIEPDTQPTIDNNINKPDKDKDKDDDDEKKGLAALFGEEMSESDKSAIIVMVLSVVIVITLAIYVILLQQRKKKE